MKPNHTGGGRSLWHAQHSLPGFYCFAAIMLTDKFFSSCGRAACCTKAFSINRCHTGAAIQRENIRTIKIKNINLPRECHGRVAVWQSGPRCIQSGKCSIAGPPFLGWRGKE